MRQTMLMTKRKPATVGEILVEEFMQPMGLTQAALAEAMGVQRKHVNELCKDRRTVTAATAVLHAPPPNPLSSRAAEHPPGLSVCASPPSATAGCSVQRLLVAVAGASRRIRLPEQAVTVKAQW